jgi:D-alanine transaminase/branched-chain amino acid aminotransferase
MVMETLGKHAILNGSLIDASDAVLPVQDRELQYGFGVYESLRMIRGKIVYPVDHIERLFYSADGIGLRHDFTTEQVHGWLLLLLTTDGIEDATVRILLMGGIEARLFITTSTMLTYPESFYSEGIKTIGYEGERMLPQYKTCSLLMNFLALRKASSLGAFEALLIDRHGLILEGTRSNVFACKGPVVYTAPSNAVLEGVTRDKIIKAIDEIGYKLVYEAPSAKDLLSGMYDEMFISSTSMGAMPVASYENHSFIATGVVARPIHALIRTWEVDALH